jgi:hypothetical protein
MKLLRGAVDPEQGSDQFKEITMEIINSVEELVAVGGGRINVNSGPASRINCSVGTGGINCTGTLEAYLAVLDSVGSHIGIAIWDSVHY